ncbi:MAG: LCP family protein [Eubacteriales bacterium]|nr:LCP family protein [Eubacteriales bacterium]
MDKKKKYKYYDEYGQPVDEYGRAINPRTGRTYEEENGDSLDDTSEFETITPAKQHAQHSKKKQSNGYQNASYGRGDADNGGWNGKKGKKKKRHRKSLLKKLIVVLVLIFALAAADVYYLLTLYTYDDTNASSLAANTQDGVMNIALFGVDTREDGSVEGTRSDAMMIMSIKNGSVKLVSLMRDSYVDVPGHGSTKLCHAYSYGGAQLAMQTINENFDMNITEYMTVDFAQMAAIIDAVGGVTVTLTEEEVAETNLHLEDYCNSNGIPYEPIEVAGEQKLDGVQAMTYGRIRKGNTGGDWQRTERQSVVLNEVFSKATSNPIHLLRFMHGMMPNITSSMSKKDFVYMGLRTIMHGVPSMEHIRLPIDGEWEYGTVSGMSVIKFSNEKMAAHLYDYLYKDIDPTADNS